MAITPPSSFMNHSADPITGRTLNRSFSPRPPNCRWRLNRLYPHRLNPFCRSGHGCWRTCKLPSIYSSPRKQEFVFPPDPFLFPQSLMVIHSKNTVRHRWISPPPPSTLWRGDCFGRESCAGWKQCAKSD